MRRGKDSDTYTHTFTFQRNSGERNVETRGQSKSKQHKKRSTHPHTHTAGRRDETLYVESKNRQKEQRTQQLIRTRHTSFLPLLSSAVYMCVYVCVASFPSLSSACSPGVLSMLCLALSSPTQNLNMVPPFYLNVY